MRIARIGKAGLSHVYARGAEIPFQTIKVTWPGALWRWAAGEGYARKRSYRADVLAAEPTDNPLGYRYTKVA